MQFRAVEKLTCIGSNLKTILNWPSSFFVSLSVTQLTSSSSNTTSKEEIESGVYDLYCQEAMEGMESLEPFKTYSERFGFILLHAESAESK